MYRRVLTALLAFGVIASAPLSAKVVVNEVMVNEPGSATTLEWIELYNDSPNQALLYTCRLRIGAATVISFLTDSILPPGEYYIICRRLYSSGSTQGFEEVWGNNSGYWGDNEFETSIRPPLDADFSLSNSGGTIELYSLVNNEVLSRLTWTEEGKDGVSWEREAPKSATIGQSVDPTGSTPAVVNSLTPVGADLSLDSVEVIPDNGSVHLSFWVVNRGVSDILAQKLSLWHLLPNGFEVPVGTLDIPDVPRGYTVLLGDVYTFDGLYAHLKATLPQDDRDRNNERVFMATGADYPPVVLNEIMPRPRDGLATEWVELRSRSRAPVDLKDWSLGDARSQALISDTTLTMSVGGYLVLADSVQAITDFYPDFAGTASRPARWPTLNDDDDEVRLVDPYGIVADNHAYSSTFDDNFTMSRGEEPSHENEWGRSRDKGGTPGAPNDVLLEPTGSRLHVAIEPAVFSPDGDGAYDEVTITVEAPPAEEYDLKIYDRQGRPVRTLVDGQPVLAPAYYWDGRSDGGNRLPIGIYILYFEAVGVESLKEPIVIAR
jgi:hypothetical protein